MARLLDTYTDAQLMRMLVQRDFTALNNILADDEITQLGKLFSYCTDTNIVLRFPNLTRALDSALSNSKVTIDFDMSKLTYIGPSAFTYFDGAGMPKKLVLNAPDIKEVAFMYADAGVEEIDAPGITNLQGIRNVFCGMKSLKKFRAQNLTKTGQYTFYVCFKLEVIDLPSVTTFEWGTFDYLTNLQTLRLGGTTIAGFDNNVFTASTPSVTAIIMDRLTNIPSFGSMGNLPTMKNGTCKIYVPQGFVTTLRAADNWKNYAGQILAIEDHMDLMPTWDD